MELNSGTLCIDDCRNELNSFLNLLYLIGWNGKLVNKTEIIRIYVELDYLCDSFCENNTYIQIYIKNRHIYHYIYIYIL